MDANAVTQIVSSVGFPIACCIVLIFFVKYVIEKFLSAVSDMNAKIMLMQEKHEEEMKTIKEALVGNTMAIREMNVTLTGLIQRGMDDGK